MLLQLVLMGLLLPLQLLIQMLLQPLLGILMELLVVLLPEMRRLFQLKRLQLLLEMRLGILLILEMLVIAADSAARPVSPSACACVGNLYAAGNPVPNDRAKLMTVCR